MKGNAKCQIKAAFHRRGEIGAGTCHRGREKGAWVLLAGGSCEQRCGGWDGLLRRNPYAVASQYGVFLEGSFLLGDKARKVSWNQICWDP